MVAKELAARGLDVLLRRPERATPTRSTSGRTSRTTPTIPSQGTFSLRAGRSVQARLAA